MPDLTPDEQYLVDFVKSPTASQQGNLFMWAYAVFGVAACCFGVYYDSIELLVTAFIVVIASRLYEEHYQRRWTGVWRRVIEKYEAAIAEAEAPKSLGTDQGESKPERSDPPCG